MYMAEHETTNLNIFRSQSKNSYITVSEQLLSLPVVQLSWDTRDFSDQYWRANYSQGVYDCISRKNDYYERYG